MNTLHRTPNTIKSLTLKLSLAEGVVIADVQGKRYRLTVPLNGLVFDNHNAAPAWFYALFPLELGNATTPVPAGLTLREIGTHQRYGSDDGAPRESIVSRLMFDLVIAGDAVTFEDIPLIAKGFPVATDAPASFTLPAFTATPDSPFVVADADAGPLDIGFVEVV